MSSRPTGREQRRGFRRSAKASSLDEGAASSGTRNRSGLVVGFVLLLIAGLTNVALYTNAAKRERVLAVRQAVPAGAKITQDDLAAVRVAVDPKVEVILASEFQSVIGQVAKVGLVPKSLLTRGELASTRVLPPGSAVVGVLIHPGQAPPVQVGDKVVVVGAPATGTVSGAAPTLLGAEVFAIDSSSSSGDLLVSLSADVPIAAQIAAVAATRPVGLILLPGGS